jgi:hypothetical protein
MRAARGLRVSYLPCDRDGDGAPTALLRKVHLIVVRPSVGSRMSDTRKATRKADCNSAGCDSRFHRCAHHLQRRRMLL